MLRVNKKMEYGVLALLHLARRPDLTASVHEIATHCHIPEPLLGKIMQSMKSVGLVGAVHGNRGGYRLEKSLSDISLLDVNNILAGPVRVAECLSQKQSDCPAKESCTIISPMGVLNQKIIALFESTSLDNLKTMRSVR